MNGRKCDIKEVKCHWNWDNELIHDLELTRCDYLLKTPEMNRYKCETVEEIEVVDEEIYDRSTDTTEYVPHNTFVNRCKKTQVANQGNTILNKTKRTILDTHKHILINFSHTNSIYTYVVNTLIVLTLM
jgi:hypothetical protein